MTQQQAIEQLRKIAQQQAMDRIDLSDVINQADDVMVNFLETIGATDLAEEFVRTKRDAAEIDYWC